MTKLPKATHAIIDSTWVTGAVSHKHLIANAVRKKKILNPVGMAIRMRIRIKRKHPPPHEQSVRKTIDDCDVVVSARRILIRVHDLHLLKSHQETNNVTVGQKRTASWVEILGLVLLQRRSNRAKNKLPREERIERYIKLLRGSLVELLSTDWIDKNATSTLMSTVDWSAHQRLSPLISDSEDLRIELGATSLCKSYR